MKRSSERGFTLPEVIVVIVVLVILLGVSLFFVRPKSYATTSDDANRRLSLATMAMGIRDYQKKTGTWPADIPDKATPISDQGSGYDLCKILVPEFLQDLAFDPQTGAAFTGDVADQQYTTDPCNSENVSYDTGFDIVKNKDGSIELLAPAAQGGTINVVIR